jgi:hypothetical protein
MEKCDKGGGSTWEREEFMGNKLQCKQNHWTQKQRILEFDANREVDFISNLQRL